MHKIYLTGTIIFDLEDLTKKHAEQSSWKKTAMVLFEPDKTSGHKGICEYYCWFIKKRFNLDLTVPIRGAHISFINDRMDEMTSHCNTKDERLELWEKVKKKWNGKKVEIPIDLRPYTSTKTHWWLIMPHDERWILQQIRDELGFINPKTGLSRPYFGMHMTIGRAVDKRPDELFNLWKKGVDDSERYVKIKRMNEHHSEYIIKLMNNGFI